MTIWLWLALLAPAQEKSPPPRHPWASWKPGTHVRYRVTQENDSGGGTGGIKTEERVTSTLLKVDKTGVFIATTFVSENENGLLEERETLPEKAGEETLPLMGKRWDCVIWKSEVTKGNWKSERRVWIPKNGDVPLKIVGYDFDGAATQIDEIVETGGKKHRCVRLEGTLGKYYPGTAVLWCSSAVPGGLVRKKVTAAGRCDRIQVEWELLKFEAD
ncbi:MAG: hypothetical protein HYY17_12635 [Planctomycetes bacterium]|nr:hypothetical protein [Planctomycetota bacterium]